MTSDKELIQLSEAELNRFTKSLLEYASNLLLKGTTLQQEPTWTRSADLHNLILAFSTADYNGSLSISIHKKQKVQVRPEFIVGMTTATMTQDVMRQAIITKSQQVLNPVAITTAAEGDSDILDTINPVVYVWVTSRDDKVCPICSGYEGQAWAFEDSASIPDIPDDTHPNCRCTLQLSEAEFIQ